MRPRFEGSSALERVPAKLAQARVPRRTRVDDDDDFLDPCTRSWGMSQACRKFRTCPCPSSSSSWRGGEYINWPPAAGLPACPSVRALFH